eukprot:403368384
MLDKKLLFQRGHTLLNNTLRSAVLNQAGASQSQINGVNSTRSFFTLSNMRNQISQQTSQMIYADKLLNKIMGTQNIRYKSTIASATPAASAEEAVEEIEYSSSDILNNSDPKKIRNLAIIAHVDHGKTTLVDCLLKQTGISFSDERAMDSNDIEKERGITILAKCTSVVHKDFKLNIVDTPGHQDFGGEVERIMTMVDGVCLVVCATEGPMPQTKFVLKKALSHGLKPIVVINKVDRDSARVQEVENEIFDLFCLLEATDEQLDYPVIYASARSGWAVNNMTKKRENVKDLFESIVSYIPHPKVDQQGELKMLITQTESNRYFGRMLIGRIHQGQMTLGDKISAVDSTGKIVETSKVIKIIKKFGMNQVELNTAFAGDIVSVAGFMNGTVNHTVNAAGKTHVIPSTPIDPPMIKLQVTFNDSPLKGQEGDKCTINQIRERILKEAEDDVSLRVSTFVVGGERVEIAGRGDLHLGVLIEKMRREGFELAVTPPEVVMQPDPKDPKKQLEPYEEVQIDTDLEYVSLLIDKINGRKGILLSADDQPDGRQMLKFKVPSRGLLGFRTELVNDTRGTALMRSQFLEYDEYCGSIKKNPKGAIISMAQGNTTAYALRDVEEKGTLFVGPNTPVYPGMVIGEYVLEDSDMEMNPTKLKKLTNIRTVGSEEQIKLQPPRLFTLEEAVTYIREDELVEVTPKWIRIRKRILDAQERKKSKRDQKKVDTR